MKQNKKVSLPKTLIIVPSLGKRLELLEITLKSIAELNKGMSDLVIVGPLDNKPLQKLAKKYNAVLLRDPGSLSGAVNVGIESAKPRHEFIGWLGDDDVLEPRSIEITSKTLDAHPEAVLAFGHCKYIDDEGKQIFINRTNKLAPWVMRWGPNLVPLIGMLYRKSELKKAGEFDISLKYAMDLDILLRLRKLGPFVNTGKITGSFRWHSSSTTVANRNASLEEARMVKRKYLPKHLQLIAPLWENPVKFATHVVAKKVSKKAKS